MGRTQCSRTHPRSEDINTRIHMRSIQACPCINNGNSPVAWMIGTVNILVGSIRLFHADAFTVLHARQPCTDYLRFGPGGCYDYLRPVLNMFYNAARLVWSGSNDPCTGEKPAELLGRAQRPYTDNAHRAAPAMRAGPLRCCSTAPCAARGSIPARALLQRPGTPEAARLAAAPGTDEYHGLPVMRDTQEDRAGPQSIFKYGDCGMRDTGTDCGVSKALKLLTVEQPDPWHCFLQRCRQRAHFNSLPHLYGSIPRLSS